MFSRVFSALSLFLLLFFAFGVERVASSPIVTTRPSPQRQHDGQAPLQPTRTGSHTHTMTPPPATITAAHLKRDDATTADDPSAAAAALLLSSSIQSVLATGLPFSILSLAATNPAAASTWLASEVLVLNQQQQTAYAATATTTTTVPTPSWYRALPTDVKAYLLAAAESMVAAAAATATTDATASTTAGSEKSGTSSEPAAQKSYAIAAAYSMSGPAIAGVLLGSVGFVGACGALFAWRARLGWFNQLAGRRPSGEVEGYERAASRAALRREFKGSRLDVDVIVEEQGQGGEGVEMGDMGGKGKDGRGGGGAEGGVVGGERDGRTGADSESVVTALPRYRPSILGNAAGWKAGWPSAWMSGR